jgi:hypothetical protein
VLPIVRGADPLPYPHLRACTRFTNLKIPTVHLLLSDMQTSTEEVEENSEHG